MTDPFRRYLRYPLEAAAAVVVYGFFALMPPATASAVGGWLGRRLGPLMSVNRRALRNIERAMPELSPAERQRVIRGMWDNLGRVVGEYPHIEYISRVDGKGRVEIVNGQYVEPFKEKCGACILFTGHLSNWELSALPLRKLGVHYAQVFRSQNNPYIERLIRRLRRLPEDKQVPKGAHGARMMVSILGNGGQVAMLIDQKLNEGIAVPFFGRDAMTAPALARLGLRYRCPLIPTRIERIGGCRFRLTIFPPIAFPKGNNRDAAVREIMTEVNAMVEGWVRERPDQWLWMHRRWPD